MKEVIAEEPAREEIKSWKDFFNANIGEEEIQQLLPSVKMGRIVLDQEEEVFHCELRKPIKKENGEMITRVTIGEPTTAQIRAAGKKGDEFGVALELLSSCSELPLGLVNRIKQRDFLMLAGVMGFFA
ncbi:MAG: phage tail assembly protein [Spirochaetales bacterium]|nr:phage tail assembly protein [Spirochaetales bacterium]